MFVSDLLLYRLTSVNGVKLWSLQFSPSSKCKCKIIQATIHTSIKKAYLLKSHPHISHVKVDIQTRRSFMYTTALQYEMYTIEVCIIHIEYPDIKAGFLFRESVSHSLTQIFLSFCHFFSFFLFYFSQKTQRAHTKCYISQ